jgi:uncharacterized coiled-coil protein SlyX
MGDPPSQQEQEQEDKIQHLDAQLTGLRARFDIWLGQIRALNARMDELEAKYR